MKKECVSRSFKLKQNPGSLSRAVSWINFSSLSRQTKRLFRSDGELSSMCVQQVDEDDENWTYRSQQRKAVSNLDEESRWTVHYTAPWHQQENVFLPSSRPPCVEDLHRQAKLNLKSVLRECDKLRRDGYRSSQYYSQGPTFSSSSSAICGSYQDDYEEIEQKCPVSSPEEEKLITIKRPKSPATNDLSDINTQTNWTKSLPLPTPEEKMRQQAQAVQTDVVPINVTAVGTGQSDFRGHSMYVPDHCSTLGRLDSYRSAMQRSETKDTSCQTEEVKVVPPSMRRIRAQKGQGIAAQMSQFSSSSGNMSVMSDSAAVIFASRQNNDIGFHSLPRVGARVSLQSLDQTQSMMSRQTEDIAGTLPHQISKLQVDDSVVHLRNNPTMGTLSRPKSQEVRSCDSEKSSSPACVVSPHATYSTSIIPNATLSSSSEVILIHAAQSVGSLDSKISSSTAFPNPRDNPAASSAISGKEDHHSSSGNWSESSSTRHSQTSDTIPSNSVMMLSLGDSAVSLSTSGNAEAGSQSMSYSSRNTAALPSPSQDSDGRSESSYSGERAQAAVSSTEHWLYRSSENSETPSRKVVCTTPGCATPVSNLSSSSLERTSVRDDSTSLYSVDHDGFYGSMHMDSGLKSDMPCNSTNGFENARESVINVFEGKEKKHQDDHSGQGDKSLARNISLKKAKKPPLPPSRTDSLRRMPKKKAQSNGQVLDETLIATLQHSLQLNLKCKNGSSPSQSPCSDYEDPWVLRSRSQSSVSASSSMMSTTAPNLYSICTVTPSQSETSSIKSEYADQWGYYSDYAAVADDQVKSPVTHSASASSALSDYSISHFSDGSRASVPQVPSGLAKPKSTSPEKSHRVTSPSSGYSSQSNTPTALTPVPVLVKSASSGNGKSKLKPKVPERKSSLLSSVSMSSSSTSLSSNTSTEGSVSVKKLDPALSPPVDSGAPPPAHPLPTPPHCPDLSPPPPPPPAEVMDLSPLSTSPTFPPPPPEANRSSEMTVMTVLHSVHQMLLLGGSKGCFQDYVHVGLTQQTDRVVHSLCIVEVFESDTANSSFLPSSTYGEETDGVATPARPRTTEDLFAAIHRSKRKVLGRKDSEDDRTRNHSPSPPVTPTGASPNLATLKQAGSIQRSVRKSSTSNDNFKALLLKKGSRCDTSSRMSAAEMLKNTDPRFHRTRTDASPDLSDSPASCSPSKSKRAQEEWAKSEGLMPRSMSFSGTRYGRSRTPPSAASSKYNVRNRIQSSPMTVISEGDGEAVEQSEGRVRRTLEEQQEGQLDMFNSDEMDMNDFPYAEEAGCKESLDPAHVDLMTQPGASRKYLNSSAEES
uniref:NHS like 1 n=1 Tax=Catharus ustulatus TaxID=91951 RepID=A0A8C3TXE8_CATUS